MGPFRGVVFHKNTFLSPSLDQKEQNYFGQPQFYSSIVPLNEALTLLGRGEGAESAHTFFRWLFLHEKRGLEVQNFVTSPNSI